MRTTAAPCFLTLPNLQFPHEAYAKKLMGLLGMNTVCLRSVRFVAAQCVSVCIPVYSYVLFSQQTEDPIWMYSTWGPGCCHPVVSSLTTSALVEGLTKG